MHILFEDKHIVAVHKERGINVHPVSDTDGSSLVDALKAQNYPHLGIHQRLDKETSGVILFSKDKIGAKCLSDLFEKRKIEKIYHALLCGAIAPATGMFRHKLSRKDGRSFESSDGKLCEADYEVIRRIGPYSLVRIRLKTGFTHQIRFQCADAGFPILGDPLYGGGNRCPFLCLSATSLAFDYNGKRIKVSAPDPEFMHADLDFILAPLMPDADLSTAEALHLCSPGESGIPQMILSKYADKVLVRHYESACEAWDNQSLATFETLLAHRYGEGNIIFKHHQIHGKNRDNACAASGDDTLVSENGVLFNVDLRAGIATGIYLDQKENRRYIRQHAFGHVLNLFAYTCAFSVCAALSPDVLSTTSVDASRAALKRGRDNFALNRIDTTNHKFYADDVFSLLRRFDKNNRRFDTVICDPPSFGRSDKGNFSLKRDLPELMSLCVKLLGDNGLLLFSLNNRGIAPGKLKQCASDAARTFNRNIQKLRILHNDNISPLDTGSRLLTLVAVLD